MVCSPLAAFTLKVCSGEFALHGREAIVTLASALNASKGRDLPLWT